MLKIKDEVDLKELEKFGFKKEAERGHTWAWEHTMEDFDSELCYYENIVWNLDDGDCGIEIHEERINNDWNYGFNIRELHIWNECDRPVSNYVFDNLFNLIKAGLVENVEE